MHAGACILQPNYVGFFFQIAGYISKWIVMLYTTTTIKSKYGFKMIFQKVYSLYLKKIR
jgi:hypothetical protein